MMAPPPLPAEYRASRRISTAPPVRPPTRKNAVTVFSHTWGEDREFPIAQGKQLDVVSNFGHGAQLFEMVPIDDGNAIVDPNKRYVVMFPPEDDDDNESDEETPVEWTRGSTLGSPNSTGHFPSKVFASQESLPNMDSMRDSLASDMDPNDLPAPPTPPGVPALALAKTKTAEELRSERLSLEIESDPKAEKKAKQRVRICEELFTTERTYVHQLLALDKLYIKPFKSNINLMSLKNSDILFSNISSLLSVNESLLAQLEERKDDNTIGEILKDFCPFFALYEAYAKYNQQAMGVLARINSPDNKAARAFRAHQDLMVQEEAAKGLNLGSLLITPIQRLPRYLMLVKEIMKNTQPSHPDMDALKEALELISNAAKLVNNSVRAPKEGLLFKRGGMVKNWKQRYFVVKDGMVRYYDSSAKTRVLGSFKVEGARLVYFSPQVYAEEGRQGDLMGITPFTDGLQQTRAYILECKSGEERDDWKKHLVLHGAVDDGDIHNATMNQGVIKEGYVKKLVTYSGFTRWVPRYVILLPGQIHYYNKKPMSIEVAPNRIVDLIPVSTLRAMKSEGFDSFELVEQPGEKSLVFRPPTANDNVGWVTDINKVIDTSRDTVRQEISGAGLEDANLEMEEPAKKMGFLVKKGGKNKNYKKRYFVLDYPDLMYFKDKVEYGIRSFVPLGTIILTDTAQVQTDEAANAFAVTPGTYAGARKYLLRGSNSKDVHSWVDAINEVQQYCRIQKLRLARERANKDKGAGVGAKGVRKIDTRGSSQMLVASTSGSPLSLLTAAGAGAGAGNFK